MKKVELKAKDCKHCIIIGTTSNGIQFGRGYCGVGERKRAIVRKDCPLLSC